MAEYVLVFVWILFCAIFASLVKTKKEELVCGIQEERYGFFFAVMVFLPLIWLAGHREHFLFDTGAYVDTFRDAPDSFADLFDYVSNTTKDKGFYFLLVIVKIFISENSTVYLTLLAIIQSIILIIFFRKYSSRYILSVFLFVASTDYISWMYNGIRQFMAVVIILAATSLIIKKKYIPLMAVVVLASTMHQSALIMIPIIFIVQGEAWNKKTLVFIFVALLAIFFVGNFTSWMDNALTDTQYKNVVTDYTVIEDDGTNPLRVLIYSLPAIISFFGRNKIIDSNDKVISICTNMSIVSAGLYLISMFTSGVFLGRLPIYCSLYSYILLPWEVDNLFKDKVKYFVYIGLVGGYLAFYFFQIYTWGLI